MSNQATMQGNKLMKLHNTMVMYGIYNAETLEKQINTVHAKHNITSHEKLFAGEHNPALFRMLYTDAFGIQQYAINSLLFLRVIQDKYISLYRELITQLCTYASAIRVLAKGYLPNTLITPRKLQGLLATNLITPTVLDGGDEIILANWPNDKHIICNINNDIPVKIPSHPYVLVNRSILCNCGIEVDTHHLLESIASCNKKITKLTMYFTINLAFANYLDVFPNLAESLTLIRDKTDYEQPLSIHLNIPCYDSSLNNRRTKLKDFLNNYINTNKNNEEIFHLQQRHAHTSLPYKNFFFNKIVNIFTFTSSIISIVTITLVIYLFCKHKHIRTIVASLILYKTKEVEANPKLNTETNNSECSTLEYIGMALTILSMVTVIFLHFRKSKLCRGYRFSNVVKVVLSISDVQNCILIKLCKTSDNIHLFKIKGTLKLGDIKLNRNYTWDTLEIYWNGIKSILNGNKIDLPKMITIKMQD